MKEEDIHTELRDSQGQASLNYDEANRECAELGLLNDKEVIVKLVRYHDHFELPGGTTLAY